MCGIVAYVGQREAYPVVLKGLKRLEYRGYDSSGVAIINENIEIYKKKGKVAELEDSLIGKNLHSTIGIGHTRWATHGEPNDINAHPHLSKSGSIAMIHNGIIENYASLKQELLSKGYIFKSETDTEVLVNFIDDILINNNCSLEEAVRVALKRVAVISHSIKMQNQLNGILKTGIAQEIRSAPKNNGEITIESRAGNLIIIQN